MSLSISDFVNFTVEQPGAALPAYNVNSIGLLTKDAPIQHYGTGAAATASESGGVVTSITVGTAGTNYITPPPVFLMGGGGTGALATANLSGTGIASITVVSGGSGYTSAPTVVIGNGYQIYVDPIQVGLDFGTSSETYNQAVEVFQQAPNILTGGGQLIIYSMASGDTLSTAITALSNIVYVGGYIFAGYTPSTSEVLAASNLIQSFNTRRLLYVPITLLSDLYSTGLAYQISQLQNQQSRMVLHSASALQARLFAAGYASRSQGVNFNGSNTTQTMNLKQIVGIPVDTGITETVAAQCQTIGVDFYASVQGLPECVSTGGNGYTDNIFNLTWLLNALQVSTFNFLGTTPTKIPQTESGMTALKGSGIIPVLQQGVINGFIAPGSWTSTTFGNPTDLIRNILDFGYYVYSQPVVQQSQVQRQARIAPLIQIAIKYAGAIQQVNGVIFINP